MGLAGFSDFERAQADEIVDTVTDSMNSGAKAHFTVDPIEKKKQMEIFFAKIKEDLNRLEARLEAAGGQYFVGNSLTWADLALFAFVDMLNDVQPGTTSSLPLIDNLMHRIQDMPNIKKWIQTRPK